MTTDEPIGVLVLGGYLGAGKTSLVNHLLSEGTGRRTLVLVNDFGSLAIDEELVAARDGEVLTLTNGCICCTMSSPLIDTLRDIRALQPSPDLVVIETSGVADPLPVAHHAMTPGYRLEGVVTVVDGETVRRRYADDLVGRSISRQLKGADVLVLNKTDVLDDARRTSVREWLTETVPGTPILEATHAQVPIALLVGRTGDGLDPPDEHGHDASDHVAVSWTSDVPVRRVALEGLMADLPSDVVRAKGVLAIADAPERRWILQRVGQRWTLEPGAPWGTETPRTRVVLIAVPMGLSEVTLRALADQLAL